MKNEDIIKKTADFVKKELDGESTGHDWLHTYRVWKMSMKIAKSEKNVDKFIVQLAALLHDVADWKFNQENSLIGSRLAGKWLRKMKVDTRIIIDVCNIIDNMSFKGMKVSSRMLTKEGMIVQDADRLDAIGAIGIARTFAFGGHVKREIYNPKLEIIQHKSFQEYKKTQTTSINHFYEKLLLLKDLMNTSLAKKIARKRHKFLENFLEEFFSEWHDSN